MVFQVQNIWVQHPCQAAAICKVFWGREADDWHVFVPIFVVCTSIGLATRLLVELLGWSSASRGAFDGIPLWRRRLISSSFQLIFASIEKLSACPCVGVKHCQEDFRFKPCSYSTIKNFASFSCSIPIVVSDESLVPFDTYSTKWTAVVLSIPTKTIKHMYLMSAVRCCVLVFRCFGGLTFEAANLDHSLRYRDIFLQA